MREANFDSRSFALNDEADSNIFDESFTTYSLVASLCGVQVSQVAPAGMCVSKRKRTPVMPFDMPLANTAELW